MGPREASRTDSHLIPPDTTASEGEILSTLRRYRDQRHWSWNLSMRLINMYYGTRYTEKQLRALYKRGK